MKARNARIGGSRFREAHGLCEEHGDIASASLIENWIDETEQRVGYLFEASRGGETVT